MDRPYGNQFATRSIVMGRNGMVATSQPLATGVGVEVLRHGGSAVDAAIAANAALGLMEPTGSGIGGDLFAIVWDANSSKLYGLNGSGRSPGNLHLEHFTQRNLERIPAYGPLSVSVPGAVDAWFTLHQRFGKRPMAEILAPTIEYARQGFPVTEIIAAYWAEDANRLREYAGFADVFMPHGRAPAAGELFANPRLAQAYELIGTQGRAAFYEGEIARSIGDYMQSQGGLLSSDDLAKHSSQWVDPVSSSYRGYDIWQLPPNGQGIATLQILNILEGYDIGGLTWGSAEHLHLLLEAKKLVFEDRARHYADPDFSDLPLRGLISKKYAAVRRQLIKMDTVLTEPSFGDPKALNRGDTVYLASADSDGNMVSLIQSNYRGMGSGMTIADFGFALQNRGELFSLEQGHPNAYAAGKRPFHTIIPGFVSQDDEPLMAFGVMGAAMQPQGHVQVLSNLIDFGMDIQSAGDAPRIRHEGSSEPTGSRMSDGGTVHLESGFSDQVHAELRALGHQIVPAHDGFGGYQAIMRDRDSGVYMGASESRKDGHAAAY